MPIARTWRDADLSLDPLIGCTISLLGYGSQGRAQAFNLRDSGLDVRVGARPPNRARADGFDVVGLEEACKSGDVIAILLPERAHAEVLSEFVNPFARADAAIVFAHGYTILYGDVKPREGLQRLLVAPKAIGPQLRRLYQEGSGAAALIAAEPGDLSIAKAYAKALGCGRRAVIESSFREETETDLFGEQAVLCGGMPALAMAAFETLVEAGYSAEAAYYECLFEIKLIADLMFEHGIAGMVDRISDTAQFGAMTAGPRVVDAHVKEALRRILNDIRSGRFAELNGQAAGVEGWRGSLRSHLIEQVRQRLESCE